MSDLEDQANRNRAELSKIYNELRAKLVERETILKRRISETLEREQAQWKRQISQMEDQIANIQAMREEANMIDKE